jgi:hypothetical protein
MFSGGITTSTFLHSTSMPSKYPELESISMGAVRVDKIPQMTVPYSRLRVLDFKGIPPFTRSITGRGARSLLNFHSFSNAINACCPILEELTLESENMEEGYFTSKEIQGYRWPQYFPADCLQLPKLKKLQLSGLAFVEGTVLSANLPELESFNCIISFPEQVKSTYGQNQVTTEHETQRVVDESILFEIKADIEENCPSIKSCALKLSVYNKSSFKVLGFEVAALRGKTDEQLEVLVEEEDGNMPMPMGFGYGFGI